jgi:outer membrane biosynthesis protein TonB
VPDPPEREPPAEPEEPPAQARAEEPAGPRPDPEATRGGENLNVQTTGEEFPFPDYLQNVVLQVNRYFRWTGTPGLEAEVYFVIRRDGTVQDIRLVHGAREVAFNFEAMAAIEQAGNRRVFGPLPDGFQGDMLPISFYFRPQR